MDEAWLQDIDDDVALSMRYSTAHFLAGYGVMRWHLGYPLGDVALNPDATGLWNLPTEAPLFPLAYPLPANVHHGEVVHMVDDEGTLASYLLQVPTAREQVLMELGGVWGEQWFHLNPRLETDPCTWPAPILQEVWPLLTMEYCLTGFDPPCTPADALRQCVTDAKAVYWDYAEAIYTLAQELVEAGRLSGEHVTSFLARYTDWLTA